MPHAHCCVWIDHREARVLGFNPDDSDLVVLRDHHAPRHIHRKADNVHLGKAAPDNAFLEEVAGALGGFRSIVLLGPGTARTDLAGYLAANHAGVAKRVIAIEAMEQSTDAEVLATARRLAHAADRMGKPEASAKRA